MYCREVRFRTQEVCPNCCLHSAQLLLPLWRLFTRKEELLSWQKQGLGLTSEGSSVFEALQHRLFLPFFTRHRYFTILPRHPGRMFPSFYLLLLSAAFMVDCSLGREDCIMSNGVDYRGHQSSSSSGLTCLMWTNTSTQYDPQTGVGDHNYCRNPDSSERPWCYITGPDATIQKQFCSLQACPELTSAQAADMEAPFPTASADTSVRLTTRSSSGDEAAAIQPVLGISQRVRTGSKKKKDMGPLGYALGIVMMAIIIVLGAGITFGYFYKRGRDLKKQHEQRVYEREMQRITLPLAAFSNPTCELVDENAIVVTAEQEVTPMQEEAEGGDPLMGQQMGTPGA
ncbi:phosphoinositide-3-kinase-interacting protein 1 [Nerophis ophidion]|uniref:phosphoinositide-3-kinase-interacting protein 1 n=1 Tax=Nerophis ophidion TaxID=159077 RepID=UPI002AE07DFD|nr:phosphoinositide-3-kinase-interacting protein 1 [Nerophis ophidion]